MTSSWMLVAAALFALMGVLVKHASAHFSSPELVFYRSVFGLIAIWLGIVWQRGQLFAPLATQHAITHFWRGLAGFIALVLFFYAVGRVPLATAVTLSYTAPLFLAVFSSVWLHERHGRGLVLALGIGFMGIVLVLQPQWQPNTWLPSLAGLVSAVFAAVAYVNIKRLGSLGEPEWRVVFYFTLLCTLAGGLWMLLAGFQRPALQDLPVLIGIGVSATLAQLALTRAYHRGRTLTVGALAYSTVVFSALYGVVLFSEQLSLTAWIGIALVIAAGILAVRASSPPAADSL